MIKKICNLQAWELYEKGELASLVDTSMNRDYDVEEACRYMKIGLCCTQDKPKLRPSMSTVVQMLMGEIDVNDTKISRPGLLYELMGLKGPKNSSDTMNTTFTNSAGSGKPETSFSSLGMTSSHATMTFNSIYDRSN
ncbi:putative serine/threonine-protein kinase isoform X3 [Tripterygium wilfordii]|uniref:Putative serine/threonine-protein kinase isoform X3 n=1 Tax=Tripterygium wilfordii TaxID=458696 RepID=A0A7J7C2A8_TRIWF|nr:putative serine/threonine-protein kinase isoform X3 [Tripterygium wilfordii]